MSEDFKPPVLRLGKNTRSFIGGRKLGAKNKPHKIECICRRCVKPKSPWKKPMWNNKVKKKSDRQHWIDTLRIPLKLAIMRIYQAKGWPDHINGCVGVAKVGEARLGALATTWDLDEISGRHTMGPIPAALWPKDHQLLRRCCHMLKTARGHVDYRPKEIKDALWELSDLLVSLLPPVSGSNPYTKKDLSKAIRRAAVKVMEDPRYQGTLREAAL